MQNMILLCEMNASEYSVLFYENGIAEKLIDIYAHLILIF